MKHQKPLQRSDLRLLVLTDESKRDFIDRRGIVELDVKLFQEARLVASKPERVLD